MVEISKIISGVLLASICSLFLVCIIMICIEGFKVFFTNLNELMQENPEIFLGVLFYWILVSTLVNWVPSWIV